MYLTKMSIINPSRTIDRIKAYMKDMIDTSVSINHNDIEKLTDLFGDVSEILIEGWCYYSNIKFRLFLKEIRYRLINIVLVNYENNRLYADNYEFDANLHHHFMNEYETLLGFLPSKVELDN